MATRLNIVYRVRGDDTWYAHDASGSFRWDPDADFDSYMDAVACANGHLQNSAVIAVGLYDHSVSGLRRYGCSLDPDVTVPSRLILLTDHPQDQ